MQRLRAAFLFVFRLAIAMAAFGLLISFYPGAEFAWYLTVAILSLAGFWLPGTYHRAGAAALLVLALSLAYFGYHRGVKYRIWQLRDEPASNACACLSPHFSYPNAGSTYDG